jgi:uncharacterized protein
MLDITLLYISVLLFFSGTISGLIGFGYPLTSMAILSILISTKLAAPILAIHAVVFSAYMLYGLRRHVNFTVSLPLLAGTATGIPFGTYLLRVLSESDIRAFLGFAIIFFCLWSTFGKIQGKTYIRNNMYGLIPGFVSGVVGGAILASGPIVVAYLTLMKFSKEVFKSTLLTWSVTMLVILHASYLISGFHSIQTLVWGLTTMPFGAIGIYAGTKIFTYINEQLLGRIVTLFLIIAGVSLLL